MHLLFKPSILGFSICLILFFRNEDSVSQDIQMILTKYYENTGGVEKWKSLNSTVKTSTFKQKQDISHFLKINTKQGKFIYERWLSFKKSNPQDTFSTCFDGDNYWRHSKQNGLQDFPFYAHHYGRYVRMSDPLFLLGADSLRLDGKRILNKGTKKIDCFRVNVFVDGSSVFYYFNPETFLPEGSSTEIGAKPLTLFSDYRWVDGLLFSFKAITFIGDNVDSEEEVESIKLNREIPLDLFEYPKSREYIFNRMRDLSFN